MSTENKKIKFYIDKILEEKKVDKLFNELNKYGNLVFFGGSVRNYFINKNEIPRDLDIVFQSNIKDIVEKTLSNLKVPYKTNKFNGLKFCINGIDIDIWMLEETWAFKEKYINCKVENLTDTVYLSIDSIAYDYTDNTLYSGFFNETVKKREISIVLDKNPFVELNLMRALIINKNFNYNFSNELKKQFVLSYKKDQNYFIKKLIEIQRSRYKEIVIDEIELKKVINNFYRDLLLDIYPVII